MQLLLYSWPNTDWILGTSQQLPVACSLTCSVLWHMRDVRRSLVPPQHVDPLPVSNVTATTIAAATATLAHPHMSNQTAPPYIAVYTHWIDVLDSWLKTEAPAATVVAVAAAAAACLCLTVSLQGHRSNIKAILFQWLEKDWTCSINSPDV